MISSSFVRRLGIMIVIAGCVLGGYFFMKSALQNDVTTTIALMGRAYQLELAQTPQARTQGLSDRLFLEPGRGMLFTFPSPVQTNFWMYHMHFPLDMVFALNGRVVYLADHVPAPATSHEAPAIVQPASVYNRVLELPAGDISQLGIHLGDRLELP